jgi:hypothetical protein
MKGFIRTLEGVIASTLLLSSAFLVAPEITTRQNQDFSTQRAETALDALRASGSLEGEINRTRLENQLNPSIPSSFNFRVLVTERDYVERSVSFSGTESVTLDRKGDRFGTQLFIGSANDLNVSFNGSQFVERFNGKGYVEKTLDVGDSDMEFEGQGDLRFRFYNWSSRGSIPDADEVRSVDYPLSGGREVRILLWRDRSS